MEGCALGHGVRVQYAATTFDQSCLSNCLNAGAGASASVFRPQASRPATDESAACGYVVLWLPASYFFISTVMAYIAVIGSGHLLHDAQRWLAHM
jgi:hypothetical protein